MLLTDEEIKEAWFKVDSKDADFRKAAHYMVLDYDKAIAKAQLKKVVEWGDEPCPHSGMAKDSDYQPLKKRECSTCWKEVE